MDYYTIQSHSPNSSCSLSVTNNVQFVKSKVLMDMEHAFDLGGPSGDMTLRKNNSPSYRN